MLFNEASFSGVGVEFLAVAILISIYKGFSGYKFMVMYGFLGVLGFLLSVIFLLLGGWSKQDREKATPYECGFEPICSKRTSLSVRFFMMAVLFVVFDVELCLLVPAFYALACVKNVVSFMSVFFFFLILFLGLWHECREGTLNWVI